MKHRIIASIIIGAAAAFFIIGSAAAAPTTTIVQNLKITGVTNAPCLTTDGTGLVGSTGCGTGGGGSSTVNHGTLPIVVSALSNGNQTSSCPTCYLTTNPSGFTTTTIQAVLNALSAAGLATYNPLTGVFTVSSSSLSLGTASQYNKSDVLTSSTVVNTPSTTIPTVYVSMFNTRTGAVTLSSGDVTTALGFTPYNSTNPNGYISSLSGALLIANNLSDLTNTGTARTSLGLGSIATHPTSDFLPSSTVVNTPSTTIPTNNNQLTNGAGFVTGQGNGVANDCVKWSTSSTVTDAGSTCGSGGGGIASYNVTSANPFLSVTTTTTSALITATSAYVGSINGATGTVANVAKTNVDNAFSAGQTITGNVTTTNETVSSTLDFAHANASGTWNFNLSNDGNYLDINTTGTIPGTNPIPYNIVLQNCPSVTTTSTAVTSSSWECALSQAENFPDGSRSFIDWDTEYYPTGTNPNVASGWFDNARGTSSILFPYDLSWNDGSVNHVGFSETPVVATSASNLNANFNLGTGKLSVGASATTTGAFVVNSNGANTCAGIYDSGASTIYGLTDSLPAPAGCTAIGGYYKGLAVQGITANTGVPIFGILNSAQSSNGKGHTALTLYDTNEVDTFNNTLDDGAGNAIVSSTLTTKNLTVTGVTNALHLGGSGGAVTGYAGSSCTNQVVTGVSASGTVTCITAVTSTPVTSYNGSTGPINHNIVGTGNVTTTNAVSGGNTTTTVSFTGVLPSANGGTATTTALGSAAFHPSTDFLASSTNLAPSSTIYVAGTYLGTSGSNLTVSSTLASSSLTFGFYNGTTTAPYSLQDVYVPTKRTLTFVACSEYAAATTTNEWYYNTTNASTGIQQVVFSGLQCGINGTTSSTFTTSTIPAGAWLYDLITAIAGTPTLSQISGTFTKL